MNKKDERAARDNGSTARLLTRLKRDRPTLFPLPADREFLHSPLCQSGSFFGGPCNCAVRLRVGKEVFE